MSNCYGFQIKPIPDESFFGLLVAIGILTGCETYSEIYSKLLGNRALCPSTLLPRKLISILEFLPREYKESPEKLCLDHTSLPYFKHFIDTDKFLSVKSTMITGKGPRIQNRLGLTGTPISENPYLKYCPACANEQWNLHGRSTWLRSHQLPGVDVCYKHGLALMNSGVPTSRIGLHSSPIQLPPLADILQDKFQIWSVGDAWEKSSPNRLIAQISHELLCWKSQSSCKGRVYRNAFINAELGHGEYGNWTLVGAFLRSKYGDLIPKKLGVNFKSDSYSHWIHKITKSKDAIQHPVQHVLIIGAMFSNLTALENALNEDIQKTFHKKNHPIANSANQSLKQSQISHLDVENLNAKRKIIQDELAKNPDLTRTELKRKYRHTYNWILTYDNQWAQSILPPKDRGYMHQNRIRERQSKLYSVDWSLLDKQLASEISELAPNLIFSRKKDNEPIVNFAEITRNSQLPYARVKKLSSYPLSSAAISYLRNQIQ